MKNKAYISVAAFTVLGLVSCESDITLDLPTPETLVVVDGIIENGQYAKIVVTKSAPYFDTINIATLAQIFITDATVILSDGMVSDTLTPHLDLTQFPPYFYQGNNPALIGQEWKRYDLTVYALGDTLTASTTIPGAVPIDSLGWAKFGDNDSLGMGLIYFKEPDSLGNFYYLLCKKPRWQSYVSVDGQDLSNDYVVNGQYISFTFFKPAQSQEWFSIASNDTSAPEVAELFSRGDTILAKLCSIDKTSFDFLRTYEDAAYSFGNPFSAPTFVQSNIKGGLGGFVGYGVSYSQYIVP